MSDRCPNMGVECLYPDCTYDDPECAAAHQELPAAPLVVEPLPAAAPMQRRNDEPVVIITADDINWNGRY